MQALSAFAIEVFSTVFRTNKFFSKLNTVIQIALGQTLTICGLKKFWVYLNCKKNPAPNLAQNFFHHNLASNLQASGLLLSSLLEGPS